MTRRYRYLGPPEIRAASLGSPHRTRIDSAQDVQRWLADNKQPSSDSPITVTYIVALDGVLWIADQHSEHVACANGEDVLAAGEMTFQPVQAGTEVVAVTNQSTGYCPEPECWPAVTAALDRAGLPHSDHVITAYHFRRCTTCGAKNLIKDDWFFCGMCDAPLSATWNFE